MKMFLFWLKLEIIPRSTYCTFNRKCYQWFKCVLKIRPQGHSNYMKWVWVVLIQCPQGLFQYGRMGTNADRSAVLSARRGMSPFLLLTPSSSFPPSFVNYFSSLFFSLSLTLLYVKSPSQHTHVCTQTLCLRDGLCLSISLQWPSYKAGVWRVRPAADAAVDWPFICSLQTVLNSH